MKSISRIFVFICLSATFPTWAQKVITLKSPDGKILFSFKLTPKMPLYQVSYEGTALINYSELGFNFKESGVFGANLKQPKAVFSQADENYDLVVGKTKTVHYQYKQVIIPLIEKKENGKTINLVVRAFNDGLAFRYEFPKQSNWDSYILTEEKSHFNLSQNPKITSLLFKNTNNSHEGLYNKTTLNDFVSKELMDMPALFEYPNKVFMAITEANLRNYAGMYLVKSGLGLKSELSPLPGQQEIKVKAILPHQTPWRVLLISNRVGALIESNILTSLNDPSRIKDTSWLKPGKTSFHWWNGDVVPDTSFVPGANFETNKYYIDFCAKNNIEYHSVIGYGGFAWYPNDWPNYGHQGTYSDVTKTIASLDMKKICDYAKSKGVAIHVWVNWKALYPQLEAAFTQFEKWGIKGMMVDFLDRDDQEMVNIQEEILQKAANHHLFIQFHGAYKPTGLSRTYPNEFTREGTWNYEQNKWRKTGITPEHDLDIAFTRLLAGATDYHLGGFRAVKPEEFKTHYIRPLMVNTRTHMLAMYVVLESYLTMVADYPEAYEGQPGFDFIQNVPTSWDETKVLNAEVGGFLTVARRKGNDWYIGTINNSIARNLKISLAFLPAGNYKAELYSDGFQTTQDPNALVKTLKTVSKADVITIDLEKGGGQVMRLVKE
ncbi:glycoside hydrolase family 97 protein [Pedobacter sp. Du54]|uniref:glycoside hydrolase family 97 protein n=1 Tax=Pedobacter anseongensis TaxID=3133439 RepID=UPI0030A1A78B